MEQYKIIEVKESVFADNDREAARLRQELKRDRTVFVIAHKLGDLSAFDQVLELENGRIVRREK